MATNRIQAKGRIEKLVVYFEKNIHQLKAPSFNETQTRNQLIDPFFEALGWDVHNRAMKPLYLQEVVPEGRVKTAFGIESKDQTALFTAKETLGKEYKEYSSILDYIAEDEYKANSREATKKPDYRFRIKGQTKFFLEAKKPSVDLVKSQDAIFQVKRYGFSGRVPVAILTNFEEFRVFDCTHKPLYGKPKLGIIKEFDFLCTSYTDRFDQLFDTFSRDAVEASSLDALTAKLLQKRTGDFDLDRTFLDDLSRWRIELARDIARHPKNRRKLNDYTLNESVQRILDRIVFFRVCEDREIEVENTLLAILRMWKDRPGVSLYSLLNQLFQQRRSLYNGLLFSPHECEELEVGDKVILEILENLNYPFSPYHFNEIGVEILGSIYEKFLGKTIHLTAKTVRVDEKPEVRKAGGVYYTPQYIVNYIVDNTVGKLLYDASTHPPTADSLSMTNNDKKQERHPERGSGATESKGVGEGRLKLSPKQVAKLKIIDIACGSGSFLLGAFQKLIEYHIEWYHTHPKDIQTINGVPDAYIDANGNLHISSRKKRDILVNNIYGVDIDRQAVEVTQMSLYLKVLEGENAETLNPQMTLALKEVYLPVLSDNIKCGNSLIGTDFTAQGELFDAEQAKKINAFDWETEFPFLRNEEPSEGSKPSEGLQRGFDCVIGNPPYGALFIESTKSYLNERFQTFVLRGESYLVFVEQAVRLLKNKGRLGYIVPDTYLNLGFTESLRNMLLQNTKLQEIVCLPSNVFSGATVDTTLLFTEKAPSVTNYHISEVTVRKFPKRSHIEDVNTPSRIISISTKSWFELGSFNVQSDLTEGNILRKVETHCKHLSNYAEMFSGIKVYEVGKGKPPQTKAIRETKPFTSKTQKGKPWSPFYDGKHIGRYELLWSEDNWIKYGGWLAAPREPENFLDEKILIRKIVGKGLLATYVPETSYCNTLLFVLKKKERTQLNYYYLLGILNSGFIGWYFRKRFQISSEDIFPQIMIRDILQLPFHTIDFTKPEEKKMHDDLVALVDKMLELHKQLQKTSFESEKEPIQRQIAATDKKIDLLVYQLYGLTEEEIKIVEGQNR